MIRSTGRPLVSLIFFLCVLSLSAQKDVTTLGLQIKPIITTSIGGGGPFTENTDVFSVDVIPRTGMSFGMMIRRGFTDNISLEFGINRVTRNYRYRVSSDILSQPTDLDFGYLNYEIPIKGLIFIQLGKQTFLTNSLGASFDFYASTVGSNNQDVSSITFREQWVKMALEANLGLEFRTKKSGYFYLGSTFHNPFSPVARSGVRIRDAVNNVEHTTSFFLTGGYLTIDFRYFFHEAPER